MYSALSAMSAMMEKALPYEPAGIRSTYSP